jgi:hypothetical protein
MQVKFNWLAIIVAAAAAMFIGFLWYGLLFQLQWAEAVGLTGPGLTEAGAEVFKHGDPVTMEPTLPMVINAITMVLYAIFFSWLTAKTDMTSLVGGASLGAILGVIMTFSHYVTNRFAMDPTSLSVIDGTYHIAIFAAIGAIVGAWRKK